MPEVEDFDVAIIGGGINGCGTFRDLCAQGVRCLLIEREDFCAGASSASSRLMHGGLKYFETGEFRLVRESATERNMLLATAPHVVTALPSIVPVRSWTGGILGSIARFLRIDARLNDRGFLITALGLGLYDAYGRRFRALPRHRMLTRAALRREMPDLDPGIVGAGLYYEGRISYAERLALELVLDGEALSPQKPRPQSRRAALSRGRRPRLSPRRPHPPGAGQSDRQRRRRLDRQGQRRSRHRQPRSSAAARARTSWWRTRRSSRRSRDAWSTSAPPTAG